MIKRTLYFGNPSYLSLSNSQLLIRNPEKDINPPVIKTGVKDTAVSIPVEDIGMVILDNQQISITNGLLQALQENNVSVMICDKRHMPQSLLLPLEGNSVLQERYDLQLNASEPLKKNLWAQTVIQKIKNQATVLEMGAIDPAYLIPLVKKVRTGDSGNCEAIAANHYWKALFSHIPGFTRYSEGSAPNHWLNYGYAVLRATMARSIVSAGLLPTLGIFHRNRYNAWCLADDLMEPFRPFVDRIVFEMLVKFGITEDLNKEHKTLLLKIPVIDVLIDDEISPLMVATQRTAVSLVKCYSGKSRKLILPAFK